LYATIASYFAGVMVRLMLTLTPVVCVAAALAVSKLLDVYMASPVEEVLVTKAAGSARSSATARNEKTKSVPVIRASGMRLVVVAPIAFILVLFAWHCTWMTATSYSSPSVVLASTKRDGSMYIFVN
jgi:dolichyl-diphosphooligosaccharide---protein glycosyltransferase